MDLPSAVEALNSTDRDIRLRGARFLALNAREQDLDVLRTAHAVETIRWIRTALDRAIDRASARTSPVNSPAFSPEPSPELVRDVRAEAIEEVAGTIIHEIAPIVGALRARLQREVPEYQTSESWKLAEMLSSLLRGIRDLKSASSVPKYAEFELSELVDEVVATLDEDSREMVSKAQAGAFPVFADRNCLSIAIGNGLRNAVEAALQNSSQLPNQVIVNWGRAGSEDWIAIIDSGLGFKGNPESAIKLGITQKANHIGFGLATAQQAIRTMEGDVYLSNSKAGGAIFELRWFRTHAHSVR